MIEASIARVAASSANAAASNDVTLPAVAAKRNWITGFTVSGAGATAASVITVQLTGVVGGPLSYKVAIPVGANVGIQPLRVEFDEPFPSADVNTAVSLTVPSFGAGNTAAAAEIRGFVT